MMKLSEIRKAYEELSGKLSDVNRQLCFAGFAIIWIFNESANELSVPHDLYCPAILLCISLFIDLLQYAFSTASWHIYYSRKRKNDCLDEEINVDEPECLNAVPWLFIYSKVCFLIAGYIFIGIFLISKL